MQNKCNHIFHKAHRLHLIPNSSEKKNESMNSEKVLLYFSIDVLSKVTYCAFKVMILCLILSKSNPRLCVASLPPGCTN